MGKFIGEVITKWPLHRPRIMILVEDVIYEDNQGRRWRAPAGSIIDGASIPRFTWAIVGSPYVGLFRYASVVHDVYCFRKNAPYKQVHQMFENAMKDSGVPKWKRAIMAQAVKRFGPKW